MIEGMMRQHRGARGDELHRRLAAPQSIEQPFELRAAKHRVAGHVAVVAPIGEKEFDGTKAHRGEDAARNVRSAGQR